MQWMKDVHVPDVMNTGYFLESHIQKMLDPAPHEPGTVTYNFQYLCKTMADLDAYVENDAPRLRDDVVQRYKDQFVAFRTILERI